VALRSIVAALAALALLVLAAPATAHADTFFVSKAGSGTECAEVAPCAEISTALTASRAAAGTEDEIRVGPGLYVERVQINDEEDAGLTLRGAGRGADVTETPADATTVRGAEDNKGFVIGVGKAAGVTIEGLRVEVPPGFVNTAGIEMGAPSATVRAAHLQSTNFQNTEAIYVTSGTPGVSILSTRVRQLGQSRGVSIFGPQATIADSDISAAGQQAVDVELTTGTRILRSRLQANEGSVVTVLGADLVIDSSLVVGGSTGVSVYAGSGGTSFVTLRNDTIDVDVPKTGADGAAVGARSEGDTSEVTLINSIALESQRVEGDGNASVSCQSSIVQFQAETGPEGSVTCGAEAGNFSAFPNALFVPGDDWHLRQGSSAVDSGKVEDALSATDLDGAPRIVDGDADGAAVIDRGAYESAAPGAGLVAPSNAFKLRKLKRNRRKGTATLQVEVPGPGRLVLFGMKVRRFAREAETAGTFNLKIVPKRKLARRLRARGKARISVNVRFTPTGGSANNRSKSVKLIRR
jgi:hypothetical protein